MMIKQATKRRASFTIKPRIMKEIARAIRANTTSESNLAVFFDAPLKTTDFEKWKKLPETDKLKCPFIYHWKLWLQDGLNGEWKTIKQWGGRFDKIGDLNKIKEPPFGTPIRTISPGQFCDAHDNGQWFEFQFEDFGLWAYYNCWKAKR